MGNVEKFYDALLKDEALRNKLNAIGEKYRDRQPSEAEASSEFIAFAKAEGYAFTAEEYKAFAESPKKISEDEMKAVAGGMSVKNAINSMRECFCVAYGAGKNSESNTMAKCACVTAGASTMENEKHLVCFGFGYVG
jgi:predicted ribosomally synthesized peptide with nif11-like leader